MTDSMIVEAIRSVKLNQTDNVAVPQGAVDPAAVANPGSVARFQAAMGVEETTGTQAVGGVPFAGQVSELWRATHDRNQEYLHRIKALSELCGRDSSAADLLELQYEVASLSFQQEVVSKVADKSSNAVQTLIKNQ